MGFCHLHCHSEYSSLDGGSRVDLMPDKLRELGMEAMALTDHGVMQGLPDFQHHLSEAGIKPILGLEAYLTPDRHDHSRGTVTWHLTLLAENTQGYHNLSQISSRAFIEGTIKTFGRPRARADWDLLAEHAEGIICLTGCMAGPVMQSIMKDGSISQAKKYTEKLVEIFGRDNVYGELQNVGITVGVPGDSEVAKILGKDPLSAEEAAGMEGYHGDVVEEVEAGEVPISQTEANAILVEEICKPLGLSYVATGDVHYLDADDADPHDAMICIGTGQIKSGERRFSLLPKKYHMRSEEEMRAAIPDYPESIDKTLEVAERCSASIEYGKELLPRFPIPENFADSKEYLEKLCRDGIEVRYGKDLGQEVEERLSYELGVIDRMGYNDYFLIVWDLFREAEERGIPAGPGRGSAAGSIVAYALGITQICPLEYGLLFERFLNPDRISMPDIDMDFGPTRRGELMEYARQKYNELAGCDTAVAQQVTFSRYKAKGAIRDSARVLADPTEEGRRDALRMGDKLAGLIPNDPKATMKSVWDDDREGKDLRAAYKSGPQQKAIIKQATWLEGLVRAYSIHAAAVLIADHDLAQDLPLQQFSADQPLHVQYEMNWAEKLGLLKMDFLGLRNLEVIEEAIEKIRHTRGVELHPYKIPIDDAKTYELFAEGRTIGTFQFESDGMRGALREVKPSEFRDLIALVALYRPGPMAYIPTYAARKAGREKTTYLHPKLEEIQAETYAITVYQEQSMLVARELAGFTPGQADDLRKAIGKKLHDKMASLKPKFLQGCADNDVPKDVAEKLWADNEAAADYSFNKSHAACYAYVAYVTGYLKANYPEEYMAALLSSVMGDKDKAPLYLTEAKSKNMNLTVLPPDINRSLRDFSVHERPGEPGEWDVLFGLTAIKKVGGAVVAEILEERKERGNFSSLGDLLRRIPHLSKGVCEALVLAGALDCTGSPRKAMFEAIEETKDAIKKERAAEERRWKNGVKEQAELLATEKLSTPQKRGLEGAALRAHALGGIPSREELGEAILDRLEKEDLRLARADARKKITDSGGDPKTDANKTAVEAEASAVVASKESSRKSSCKKLVDLSEKALEKFLEDSSEDDGLESALQDEMDAPIKGAEWERSEMLQRERDVLGIFASGHPFDDWMDQWQHSADEGMGRIDDKYIGKTIHAIGVLVALNEQRLKNGKKLYKIVLDDPTGSREILGWQEAIEGYESLLQEGSFIAADIQVQEDLFQQARAEEEEENPEAGRATKLQIGRMWRWRPEDVPPTWVLEVPRSSWNPEFRNELEEIATKNPGDHRIKFVLVSSQDRIWRKSKNRDGESLSIERSSKVESEINQLIKKHHRDIYEIPLQAEKLDNDFLSKLQSLAGKHEGEERIVLLVRQDNGTIKRKTTPWSVTKSADLEKEILEIV